MELIMIFRGGGNCWGYFILFIGYGVEFIINVLDEKMRRQVSEQIGILMFVVMSFYYFVGNRKYQFYLFFKQFSGFLW